jgi:hypothetical protein
MSDSDLGKKMVEEQHLYCFLEAYATVTGLAMKVVSNGESPDFICTRPSGECVGVELSRSPHDYHVALHDRIWTERTMSAHQLLDAVNAVVTVKEQKRQSGRWRTPDNTILVIELIDYRFASLGWTQDRSHSDYYVGTGFLEIWLADYSTLEPFGEVRLIGLFPPRFWGLHRQPALDRKPYG